MGADFFYTCEIRDGVVVNSNSPAFTALMERMIAKYGAEELFRRVNAQPKAGKPK